MFEIYKYYFSNCYESVREALIGLKVKADSNKKIILISVFGLFLLYLTYSYVRNDVKYYYWIFLLVMVYFFIIFFQKMGKPDYKYYDFIKDMLLPLSIFLIGTILSNQDSEILKSTNNFTESIDRNNILDMLSKTTNTKILRQLRKEIDNQSIFSNDLEKESALSAYRRNIYVPLPTLTLDSDKDFLEETKASVELGARYSIRHSKSYDVLSKQFDDYKIIDDYINSLIFRMNYKSSDYNSTYSKYRASNYSRLSDFIDLTNLQYGGLTSSNYATIVDTILYNAYSRNYLYPTGELFAFDSNIVYELSQRFFRGKIYNNHTLKIKADVLNWIAEYLFTLADDTGIYSFSLPTGDKNKNANIKININKYSNYDNKYDINCQYTHDCDRAEFTNKNDLLKELIFRFSGNILTGDDIELNLFNINQWDETTNKIEPNNIIRLIEVLNYATQKFYSGKDSDLSLYTLKKFFYGINDLSKNLIGHKNNNNGEISLLEKYYYDNMIDDNEISLDKYKLSLKNKIFKIANTIKKDPDLGYYDDEAIKTAANLFETLAQTNSRN